MYTAEGLRTLQNTTVNDMETKSVSLFTGDDLVNTHSQVNASYLISAPPLRCDVYVGCSPLINALCLIDNPPPPPQRIASKIKETLNSVKSYNLFSSVLGWQWLANCILNDLKFKVRIVLFNLLNFCAQYVSNFHEVCHSPVASRNNETHSILFFYLFVTVRRFVAKGAGKPASALEDIDIEL